VSTRTVDKTPVGRGDMGARAAVGECSAEPDAAGGRTEMERGTSNADGVVAGVVAVAVVVAVVMDVEDDDGADNADGVGGGVGTGAGAGAGARAAAASTGGMQAGVTCRQVRGCRAEVNTTAAVAADDRDEGDTAEAAEAGLRAAEWVVAAFGSTLPSSSPSTGGKS
jgi:hypothetical protein